MSHSCRRGNNCLNDIEKISKKRKAYFYHFISGIVCWFMIQLSWLFHWITEDKYSPMTLTEIALCFISVAIPIFIITVTHKKYRVIKGYETLFKIIEKYNEEHPESNEKDNKSNI